MTWYCASILIALSKKDGADESYLVYENFVLIDGSTADDALERAKEIGRREAAIDDGLMIDDVPGKREFCGIRKLITVSNPHPLSQSEDQPVSESEVSFSLYRVNGRKDLHELSEGNSVTLAYLE